MHANLGFALRALHCDARVDNLYRYNAIRYEYDSAIEKFNVD